MDFFGGYQVLISMVGYEKTIRLTRLNISSLTKTKVFYKPNMYICIYIYIYLLLDIYMYKIIYIYECNYIH